MFVPAGTFVSVNVPSGPVNALTSGLPDTSAPHWVHATPGANGCTAAFGTYTTAFGMGSATPPAGKYVAGVGARTVPVSVVVAPPSQWTCCRHRFVHGPASVPASVGPHTLGTPPPPQISGAVQPPPHVMVP